MEAASNVPRPPLTASQLVKEELKAEMRYQGLNQSNLAALAGIHPATVSRALSPTLDAKLSRICQLAAALDCHVTIEADCAGGAA